VKQWSASNTTCGSTATPVYAESYLYNSKALVSTKTITTGGVNYTTTSTYDSYGRPYELTYPTVGAITGPKIRTEYSFGAAYKTTDYSSGSASTVYHHTTAVNARGQSTGVTYGNGVTASFTYGDDTGWLKGNTVTKGGTTIQSYNYGFDYVGNVTSRQLGYGTGSSANVTETFGYDNLHRLTSRTVNSALNLSGALAMSESYGYDAMGNLTSKPGVGNYSFIYDANGNVTNDSKRSFIYTAFEKPSKIQQNTDFTDFEYGPNRELIKRIDKRGNNITSTLMLDGYEQITLPTGVVEHKYSVGDAIITKRSNGANETYYLHKDQQGSTTAITNAAGTTVQQLMYDPWGKQHVVNTSLLTYTSPAQSKGYTGHEMVNDFEVIHMGGRTYNPVLGRFMQADPFIQAPGNLQNYNRYSYVLNNPMSYTDPSGYFFKKLFSAIAKVPILDAVVKVGITIWLGPLAGALYNFAQTYTLTGSLGRGLRSGIVSFASGLAFGAVGGSTSMGSWQNILGNALVGGVEAELQGGKFGHGFAAAGFAAFAKPMNVRMWGISQAAATARVITAAVIGGTGSVIAGGKFANGAVTGAFSQIFNGEKQVQEARDAFLKKTGVTNSQLNAIFKLKLSVDNLAEAISNRDKFTDLIGEMNGTDLKILSRAVGLTEGQIDGYYRFGGDNGLRVKLDQEYRRTHMWNALENAANAASAAQELIYIKPIENIAFREYPDWFKKWYDIYGTISSEAD